jgi:hypothetical protein
LLSVAAVAAIGAIGFGSGAGASSAPIQYFTGVQTSPNGPQRVIAAGLISATGTDTVLGNHRDTFSFPKGTLTVRHEPTQHREAFDRRTCVFTFTESGTYVIARGTGAYSHVTGSGVYRARGVGQGCEQNAPPDSFVLTIEAEGPLSL